jgi:type II secretory pathway predicted ATPase ExeA
MDFRFYHRGFAPTPELRLRFAHGSYAVAQDAVERALHNGAAVALVTGPRGSGKTLLAADIAQRQQLHDIPVARIVADDADLLRAVACAFNLQVSRANRATVSTTLVRYLANRRREGRTPVVVIDEADRLDADALKELWRLGNPRSQVTPMLQLVLAGGAALLDRLQAPQFAAIWRAVGAVGELKPLDAPQTRAYIAHRLGCSGWNGNPSLSAEALRCVHRLAAGHPAHINLVMERLLRYGVNLGLTTLEHTDVERICGVLSETEQLVHRDLRRHCGSGLPPVGPALRPLDAAVAAEFAAVAASAQGKPAAASPTPGTAPPGGAALQTGSSSLRDWIAAATLRRRLGLVALIGMTIATSALGTSSIGAPHSLPGPGRQLAESAPVADATRRLGGGREAGVAADAAPPGLIPQHAAAR